MTTEVETKALVKAIRENASRLGLTWERRFGTVHSVRGLSLTVVLDGDGSGEDQTNNQTGGVSGAYVTCSSLIGQVPTGTRVAVDSVPPDAHFVTGVLSTNPAKLVAQQANGAAPLLGLAGATTTGPAGATSFTTAVSFGVTFPSIPFMPAPNINSGAGSTSGWNVRAISITTTGFTLFGFGASSTFSVSINWLAVINS